MTGPILVPLDGSPLAERALLQGVQLAQRFGSELLLLRILPHPQAEFCLVSGQPITMAEQKAALSRYAAEYLLEMARRVVPAEILATPLVVSGYASECITHVAEERDVAYLVMSTYGHAGVTRWALGSVTNRVLRLAPRPLLLIPPHAPRRTLDLERILVPLDGSPLSETVLSQVRVLTRTYGAQVLLFRVVPASIPDLLHRAFPWIYTEWSATTRREAHLYLQRIAETLQNEGIRAHYEVGEGTPAEGILQMVESAGIDLVAMSTHSRDQTHLALLGSVTDQVVRAGRCPVLVIRPAPAAAHHLPPLHNEFLSPGRSDEPYY